MLTLPDKKTLDQMESDLKIFEGKIINMQVTNGEGPVFDDLINSLKDTFSNIRRVKTKVSFN